MFSNFYEIKPKNMVETEGPQMTSQYGAYTLRAGVARLHARMRMHKPTRSGTHIHAHTRKCAHTDQHVTLIAFSQQQWLRERASMLRYTYIACLLYIITLADNAASKSFSNVNYFTSSFCVNKFVGPGKLSRHSDWTMG